ncbi:MAG: transcription antitermination factor NusB [Verrucomicrobia bacterium]|nr:MAG: transcription antitermination factor NusB [Verrucomicrobiota bacterium]
MSQFTHRRDGRQAAVQYLYSWSINTPEDLNADLGLFFEGLEQPRDAYAFGEELIHGCIENLDIIDTRIRNLAQNWDFARIAKVDLAILRIAIFEMLFRRDIPPVVSINEAIDLGKHYSSSDSRRFINGILDRVKDQLDRPSREAVTD